MMMICVFSDGQVSRRHSGNARPGGLQHIRLVGAIDASHWLLYQDGGQSRFWSEDGVRWTVHGSVFHGTFKGRGNPRHPASSTWKPQGCRIPRGGTRAMIKRIPLMAMVLSRLPGAASSRPADFHLPLHPQSHSGRRHHMRHVLHAGFQHVRNVVAGEK